jgi:alkylation response protein AidB-like acyl-CoA dehydrogenase
MNAQTGRNVCAVNFGFDEDQEALRESADKVLAAECPPSVVRAALEDPGVWKPLWDTIVGLGWTGLAIPQEHGGLGLGTVDLVALAEITGRWALPVPFVSTAGLAGPVLLAAGAGDVLARLAEGEVATLAVHGSDDHKVVVPDAVRASTFVVVRAGGIAVVPSADVTVTPTHSVDPNRPLADVTIDPAVTIAVDGDELERALDAASTVLAAELVGVTDRLLEISVDHARSRQQFDRPIGSFQGVKHRLADLYVALERARTLTYDAAMLLDDPTAERAVRTRTASMAKAAASEAALFAARTGVQVHGAIGITWEHDVHLYARRARCSALLLGDHLHHYRRVAELYLGEAV